MLELDLVKKHCRIDPDDTDQDDNLETYIDAAASHIEAYTRRTLYATKDAEGYAEDESPLLMTSNVQVAMLLLIAHWYMNRESVVLGMVPSEVQQTFTHLLQPYRIYGVS